MERERDVCEECAFFLFCFGFVIHHQEKEKRERNAQKKKRHKSHAKDKIKDAHFFLLHKERAIERERRKRRTNNDVFWSDDASAEEAKNRSERFVGRDCE